MAIRFDDDEDEVMNEINMTPLVDVMLVLLIIFIITAPVMKHAVQLELPKADAQAVQAQPAVVGLSIDAQGQYFVNQEAVAVADLPTRLKAEAIKVPQPQLQIHGDKAVPYQHVALAMATAQQVGWHNMAFVTDQPDAAHAH
jgi:biopolymer transport protein ExbD